MDWQLIPVCLIVTGAVYYLGREGLRSWRTSKFGCGGRCGCGSKASVPTPENGHVTLVSAEQLSSRLRQRNRSG